MFGVGLFWGSLARSLRPVRLGQGVATRQLLPFGVLHSNPTVLLRQRHTSASIAEPLPRNLVA